MTITRPVEVDDLLDTPMGATPALDRLFARPTPFGQPFTPKDNR